MIRITRIFTLVGILFVLTVSCTGKSIVTKTSEVKISWWVKWLTRPACQPPCWQHITPDVTTREDALYILENDPSVTITYDGEFGISWNFGMESEIGNITISKNGMVSGIWLGVSADESLNLNEVVEVYGFPQYVDPYDCREDMCSTALVYPDLGIYLDVFLENTGTKNKMPKVEIIPRTMVDRVYFIGKGLSNYRTLPEDQDNEVLMPWHGYGEYLSAVSPSR